MDLRERLIDAIQRELDEHGYEDDDEKRCQVANHFVEVLSSVPRVAIVELPEEGLVGVLRPKEARALAGKLLRGAVDAEAAARVLARELLNKAADAETGKGVADGRGGV